MNGLHASLKHIRTSIYNKLKVPNTSYLMCSIIFKIYTFSKISCSILVTYIRYCSGVALVDLTDQDTLCKLIMTLGSSKKHITDNIF